MQEMMRAARFHEYGPPENLVVEQVPRPEPQAGQVLVRVRAAGVNPVDWKLRRGYLKEYVPLQLPHTAGIDLAGTVEALGTGVTRFEVGQAVYGRGAGTYAEYALVQTDGIAAKPSRLTFDQAASVPTGTATAWLGLFDAGGLQPGQRVLIHGAAGGVGGFAVQLARCKGAHVTGTASAANVEFVRSLGAETALDYAAAPFETVVRDVDVVLDTVGGEVQGRSLQALRPGGILVAVAGTPPEQAAAERGVRAAGVQGNPTADLLRTFAGLFDAGDLVPLLGPVFPLEQAAQAHAVSETGHGRGRIVLHVAD
jgi:NADPH:quinone reductase-like Zn-dependent oxidoreductase